MSMSIKMKCAHKNYNKTTYIIIGGFCMYPCFFGACLNYLYLLSWIIGDSKLSIQLHKFCKFIALHKVFRQDVLGSLSLTRRTCQNPLSWIIGDSKLSTSFHPSAYPLSWICSTLGKFHFFNFVDFVQFPRYPDSLRFVRPQIRCLGFFALNGTPVFF